MTDFFVPCRQPYQAYPAREDDAIVILNIGRGDEMERIEASVPVLCSGSEYFQERLSNRDREMSHLPLSFPSETPAFFKIFIRFLTTGELHHPKFQSSTRSDMALSFIVELFAFSATFSALSFRNALLDAFFLRLASSPLRVRDIPIRAVYACTKENSSLRDMLVTVVVHTGRKKDVKRDLDGLPKEFLADCLCVAADCGVVPFEHGRGREEWMERKGERICGEYHVHDEDEDEEDVEKDGDDDMDNDWDDIGHDGGRHGGEVEISERTKQELAFIDEMRKVRIRY